MEPRAPGEGLQLVHKTLDVVEKLSGAAAREHQVSREGDALSYRMIDFFLGAATDADVSSEQVQQAVFNLRDFFQKLAAAQSKASRGGDLSPDRDPSS